MNSVLNRLRRHIDDIAKSRAPIAADPISIRANEATAEVIANHIHATSKRLGVVGAAAAEAQRERIDASAEVQTQRESVQKADVELDATPAYSNTRLVGLLLTAVTACVLLGYPLATLLVEPLAIFLQGPLAAAWLQQILGIGSQVSHALAYGRDASVALNESLLRENLDWRPLAIHETATTTARYITCGLLAVEILPHLFVRKLGRVQNGALVLANVLFCFGYYLLRNPDLQRIEPAALAVTIVELAILVALLVGAVVLGTGLGDELDIKQVYLRARAARDTAHQRLDAAVRRRAKAEENCKSLAEEGDALEAAQRIESEQIASELQARMQTHAAESAVRDGKDWLKQILDCVDKGAKWNIGMSALSQTLSAIGHRNRERRESQLRNGVEQAEDRLLRAASPAPAPRQLGSDAMSALVVCPAACTALVVWLALVMSNAHSWIGALISAVIAGLVHGALLCTVLVGWMHGAAPNRDCARWEFYWLVPATGICLGAVVGLTAHADLGAVIAIGLLASASSFAIAWVARRQQLQLYDHETHAWRVEHCSEHLVECRERYAHWRTAGRKASRELWQEEVVEPLTKHPAAEAERHDSTEEAPESCRRWAVSGGMT